MASTAEYCLLWINSDWTCLARSDWASWVQAIGSIAAIVAAGAAVYMQLRHQTDLLRKRDVAHLTSIWITTYHCRARLENLTGEGAIVWIEGTDPAGISIGVAMLRSIPLLDVPDPLAATAVTAVLEAFDQYKDGMESLDAVTAPLSSAARWRHALKYIEPALKTFGFAERRLRAALERLGADVSDVSLMRINGKDFPPLSAQPTSTNPKSAASHN